MITSNHPPTAWWPGLDAATYAAFERRFEIKNMDDANQYNPDPECPVSSVLVEEAELKDPVDLDDDVVEIDSLPSQRADPDSVSSFTTIIHSATGVTIVRHGVIPHGASYASRSYRTQTNVSLHY